MKINLFLNSEKQLRNGWWILIFFLVLASLLVPTLITAQQNNTEVSIGLQAVIIIFTSITCQLLRQKPLTEITGKPSMRWGWELFLGGLIGSALMLIPALIMGIFGWARWQWNPTGFPALSSSLLIFAGVAVAEELLFRGFIFQRLISALGQWPALLITAAFFLLTHLNNPGMTGSIKMLAGINIFLASILLGITYLRTRNLAMPLGLHWMANWVQGGILGFGVSGTEQSGLLLPVFKQVPAWLTGGTFGIEASILGLLCLASLLIFQYKQKLLMENLNQ